jgi:uncharacterized protein
MVKELENLKAFLDLEYSGPFDYLFKFIVPSEHVDKLRNMFPNIPLQSKTSKNGKYISISFNKLMQNSKEVIDLYQSIADIPGIISL